MMASDSPSDMGAPDQYRLGWYWGRIQGVFVLFAVCGSILRLTRQCAATSAVSHDIANLGSNQPKSLDSLPLTMTMLYLMLK